MTSRHCFRSICSCLSVFSFKIPFVLYERNVEYRCSLLQVAMVLHPHLGAKLVKLFEKQIYSVKNVDYSVKKIYFLEKYEHKSRKKA